ncbi:MAG: TPM domain-containing protein [Flavobacteriaceae bacterium]|nr:TPM domain-containing protein [Flavobacteriaceae bacterium]
MHYQLKYLTLLVAFFFISINCFSQEIPKKKYDDRAVQDYIGLLSEGEQQLLNNKLKNYADSTSTGIVIAIRNDIEDDIDFYAANMLAEWGIGQKGKDNGVLLLLDTNQRRVAISTGYGVEHLLTDALSRRIIENDITPEFKKGDFYKGLDNGTTSIMQVLSGEFKGTPSTGNEGIPIIFIIIFFIILLIILSNRNRGGGGGRRYKNDDAARSLLEAIILSRAGRGGFSGGGFGSGSSGGGFGGFGGGMGGGGGASGSW